DPGAVLLRPRRAGQAAVRDARADPVLAVARRQHGAERAAGIRSRERDGGALMAIKTYGTMAVDWERRIDFDRLRRERLDRIKGLLKKSELGSVLCFDMNNVRYITATHIGPWAQDKISRFTLLAQGAEPILWDFGSAARHHQLNCDWLGARSRGGIPLMGGAAAPGMGGSEGAPRNA